MKKTGVYIHIPFCRAKCHYCDFPSFAGKDALFAPYKDAVIHEIKKSAELRQAGEIDTIYIGGGTPTALPPVFLAQMLEAVKNFPVVDSAEITVEANPGTLSRQTLQMLKTAGFNRLSMGLQAWQDSLLKTLGRIHDRAAFLENYQTAVEIGFDNISLDLMFSLPGQTPEAWRETLENAVLLGPRHISAYSLIVEEGTLFYQWREEGALTLPDEETDRRMYLMTEEILRKNGYFQYEISNYAKPGSASRHNSKYWRRENTLGFGLGSHSFWDETRWHNTYDLETYLRDPACREDAASVSRKEAMEETMFLGLRMNEGVAFAPFQQKFGVSMKSVYGGVMRNLVSQKLLRMDGTRAALTPKGRDVSNRVFTAFLL